MSTQSMRNSLLPKEDQSCRQKFCKRRMPTLAHNGWKLSLVFCTMNIMLTAFSYALPWWEVDFWSHCDDFHLTVRLFDGVCTVNNPGGNGQSDCIHWNDDHRWEAIDEDTGSHTKTTAHTTYRFVRYLTLTSLVVGSLQVAVALLALNYPTYVRSLQKAMILLSIIYQEVVIIAQSVGGENDITATTTWSDYYHLTCAESNSNPSYAHILYGTAQSIVGIVIFYTCCPGWCCSFHLVVHEESIFTDESSMYRAINAAVQDAPHRGAIATNGNSEKCDAITSYYSGLRLCRDGEMEESYLKPRSHSCCSDLSHSSSIGSIGISSELPAGSSYLPPPAAACVHKIAYDSNVDTSVI